MCVVVDDDRERDQHDEDHDEEQMRDHRVARNSAAYNARNMVEPIRT